MVFQQSKTFPLPAVISTPSNQTLTAWISVITVITDIRFVGDVAIDVVLVTNGIDYSPASGHLYTIKSNFNSVDEIRNLEYEYDLMDNVTQSSYLLTI
jgi:hypothetical protein